MWAVFCVGIAILLVQNDLVEGQSTIQVSGSGSAASNTGTDAGGTGAAAGGTGTGGSGNGTGSSSTGSAGGGGSGALPLANTIGSWTILLIMLMMCIMMQ